ncbi:MAG: hypothetical protein WCQ50_01365 [Spirochaetota bacterium]
MHGSSEDALRGSGLRHRGHARLLAALALAACALACGAETAAPPSGSVAGGIPLVAPPGRGLLAEGPARVGGLPFFPSNATPALSGSYLVASDRITFWFTRSTLYFSPAWKDSPNLATATGVPASVLVQGERQVLALRWKDHSLFLSAPSGRELPRAFVVALVRRFSFFYGSVTSDAELSFPAAVDF